ncbi:hypothetical protein Desca_0854 [Desulfotomaculum nigrificans CO-1-SRB]|uniref:ThiamineS protein n=1 Tax=Desulfotomaculum nigrificans (strain DSM 14880 / VKM B-2319 / CO-1-SRB) TaxID=868595 RepID=F6B9F8_DESCC|nr:hypothetical protein [Desulfotomaculum nigrificans]AEF93734.1 hypothetical protein Desca_0854 [Desulfotomaculum nigrificans CO-1-SRB]
MDKPDRIRVFIRYLGVVRLLSGRRGDILEFSQPVTVARVLQHLEELLPDPVFKEVDRQTLVLSPEPGAPGMALRIPDDQDKMVHNGNCLTVVTPVTGG